MKTNLLFLFTLLCSLFVNVNAANFVIADFENKNIGDTYALKAWNTVDGNAKVAADPANANKKAINVVTTNWDAILKLDVTLPSGKTLGDYDSFSFDIYFATNANDENPNYKNMFIYIDGEKKYESTGYAKQGEVQKWTTREFVLADLNLSDTEKAKTSFTIAFGVSTNKGDYYIDNVKLAGGTTSEPENGFVVIDNFNNKTIGDPYTLKAWNEVDGSASVAADPTNASNNVVNVVTTNWDAILILTATLPSGKHLSDYESFLFDLYIGPNANDENPNYKNMFIFIDNEKKLEGTGYSKQVDLEKWTTKEFLLADLNLTDTEKAKTSFTIAFGISTNKGNYYIDNVKLKEAVGSGIENENAISDLYVLNNILYWGDKTASEVHVLDLKGTSISITKNASSVDLVDLPRGVSLIKITIDGKSFIHKIIK